MSARYDAIVVGLGAMGSAAVYQLAKAGARVLGIDRHHPPHDLGSSHGETRITRLAVGEGSQYVPLVKRSHELWREIEAETGETLLVQTGMLLVGADRAVALHGADDFLAATIAVAREHDVGHEVLGVDEVRARFPQFALSGTERGAYYEPGAGYVRPERAVAAQLELARRHGAELRLGERVTEAGRTHVVAGGERLAAGAVVLAVGPWVGDFVPERFRVHRQVFFWFEANEQLDGMPIFIWELGRGPDDFVYGFPPVDGTVKLASESYASPTTPDACARDVGDEEIARFHRQFVAGRVPGVGNRCVRASTCLYTVAPDRGFVIDELPDRPQVLLASPCSGHGFKHSAAIGEHVAQRLDRGV